MLTIAQLTQHAADSDGGSELSGQARSRCFAAAHAAATWAWTWRQWPWSRQELSYTGTAPYATGTAAVTNGSAVVSFTGATLPAFAAPAYLRVDATGEEYQVAARTSSSAIQLAQPYAGSTASGLAYNLVFPTIELAGNVEAVERVTCPAASFDIRPASWGDWLAYRWFANQGFPHSYIFQPPDPATGTAAKIILWPAAAAQQVRVATRLSVGALVMYESGTAAATAGSTSVAGTNTAWQKMGFPAAGLALEFPRVMDMNWSIREIRQKVSTAGSDTALTLAAAWSGPDVSPSSTTNNYALSSILPFPDSFRDALFLKVRSRRLIDEGRLDEGATLSQAAEQAIARAGGRAFGGDAIIGLGGAPWREPRGWDSGNAYVLNQG